MVWKEIAINKTKRIKEELAMTERKMLKKQRLNGVIKLMKGRIYNTQWGYAIKNNLYIFVMSAITNFFLKGQLIVLFIF